MKGEERRGRPNANVGSCIKTNSHQGHSCADGPLSMSTHQTRASSRDGQLCVATSRGTGGARSQAGLGIKLLQGLSCAQEECTLFLALYSPSPQKKNCLKFLNRMLGKKKTQWVHGIQSRASTAIPERWLQLAGPMEGAPGAPGWGWGLSGDGLGEARLYNGEGSLRPTPGAGGAQSRWETPLCASVWPRSCAPDCLVLMPHTLPTARALLTDAQGRGDAQAQQVLVQQEERQEEAVVGPETGNGPAAPAGEDGHQPAAM